MKSKVGKKEKRQAVFRKAIAIVASVAMLTLVIPASFASNVASSTAGTPESAIASVEVSLDLGNGYIVYDGQTIAAPSSAITVPEGKDFVFSASADTGYDLDAVRMGLNGSTSELTRIADGTYTVGASNVENGLSITLATTAQQSAAQNTAAVDITQSESQATQAGNTKTVYTYEDDSVTVTATLQDANAVPDGAVFKVTPVTKETQGYNYDAYMNALNDQDKSSGETHNDQNTLLYDIAFMYLGKEYEPASGSVKVDIQFKNSQLTNGIGTQSSQDVSVSHLALSDAKKDSVATTKDATNISSADIKVETLAADASIEGAQTTSFTADSFSVFSISSIGQTMAWQGTEALTSDRLVAGVGRANDYAVFAENLTNTDHIEGNVATDNYYVGGGSASFDQLDNIYKQNILSGITVIKRVEGGLADGTFKFGIYDRSGSLLTTHEVTTSGGTGQTHVDVQANDTLKNAALNGALYVYELDGDRPLYAGGENGEGSYSVRYETLDGSTEVAGSQFSSARLSNYVGKVFLTDGNVNSSMNLNDIRGHVLPGNNNTLTVNYGDHPLGGAIELGEPYESTWGGQNRNDLVVHAQNGTWYINKEARAESPADYVTPVSNQTMVREYLDSVLKPFSATLARANSSKEGTSNGDAGGTTYVINIDGKSGSLASSLSAAGYTHVNDGNGFISGFKDGDFVVVNIDCTGMDKFDIDNFIIDGKQSSGDYNNYFANHLIFNPVEKDASGNYVAYSGTVNLTGNYSGIMFAPGATIKIGNVLCGQLIGETVIRGGSEIHKKTMTDSTAIEHSAEVTIVNSKAGVSGNLTITKAFGEGSLIDAANLSDAQKSSIAFTVTGQNGYSSSFTYADMQGGSLTLTNLAVGDYTVTETNADVDGYTAQTSYSVAGGTTSVVDSQTSQVTVTNTYQVDTSAHLVLSAHKSLEGADAQLKAGDFAFKVTESGQTVAEGTNDAAGLVTFSDIKYTQPGEHDYVISETNTHKSGYEYDTNTYKAHVSVVNGADGKLVANVTYDTSDGKAPTFVNTYENNKSNQIRITANKTLNGQASMQAGAFTFNLKDWSGAVIATATNDANGLVKFPLIDYKGDYTWNNYLFLTEEIPDAAVNASGKTYGELKASDERLSGPFVLNGVSYDASEYLVKIANVSYKPWPNNNEIASYDVQYQQVTGYAWGNRQYNSQASATPPTFGNRSESGTKGSLTVTKAIAGDKSADTLSLEQKQAIVFTVTGPNGYSTSFTYADMQDGSKTLEDLEIGDYAVTESAQGSVAAGYTLAVEGNGSTARVVADSTAQVELTNTYSYNANGSAHIDVQKSYAGTYPQGGFGFTLTGVDGAPLPGGAQVASLSVSNADKASFGDIAFNISDISDGIVVGGRLMKEFTYMVSENLPDGVTAASPTKDGITYDTAAHTVKVMVWDKGDGTLGTAVDYGTQGADALNISNSYAARGHIDFEGTKTLRGAALNADIAAGFTYEILDEQGKRVGLGTTNADGTISYDSIDYYLNADKNDVGQHTYTVREIMPEGLSYDEATGKWAGSSCYLYDGTNHTVVVNVADNANGTLSATVASVDGNSALKTLDFENAYRASGSATITATKELLGRELKAGEFTFELKDTNGRVIQTAKNDEHGAVTFRPIQYSTGDLEHATKGADGGYEFAYTITEQKGSARGVSYTDASVDVTVKVTDDSSGTLSAVASYASERGAVFTNTYSAQGTTSVNVTKDYNNWANAQAGFDFTITAEEGTPLPEKTTVTATQQNKTPSFGVIAFTTADLQGGALVNGKLTKSFTYVVSENAPAAVYNGVTYDTAPRTLTVTATDNGDGTITCVQSVTKDGSASNLSFTNTYDARGSVTLQGLKSMEGRNLTADDSFSFTITPTDQGGNAIEGARTYQATSSGANGAISYPQIFYTLDDMANADGSFASSKTFYYTVTENIPDDATITTASGEKVAYKDATEDQKKTGGFSKNGVTFATAPQKFTVTVTDTGTGVLSAQAKLADSSSTGTNTLSAASSDANGYEASRSSSGLARFATNLNGSYDSTVTTTISGKPVPQQSGKTFDIVFVVDTSASQNNTAEALMNKMLAEAEAGGYKVNIGIVKYYYVAKVVRNLDGSAGWDGSGKTNGTNLPAGILLGTKMLDDDTSVADENKYLVVLSDGDSYIYQDDNQLNAYKDGKGVLRTAGDDAMVVTQRDSDYINVPFAGPGSYSWKYFNGNREPEDFAAPANWDQYFAAVSSQVQADNGAYETKWDWHTDNRYANATNAIPENEVANHAVSADTSLYYSLVDYRAAAAKYHTYATFVYGGYDRPYGESFMAYLNGGESFDMAKLEQQLLSDIQGAVNGGEIVDTIGSGYDDHGNAYDIDFVNSIDTTDIVFNGVTLDKRINADGTFSFGTNVDGVFNELFKFTYTPAIETGGNETASDSYTVTFSNAVSSTDTIQLRYNVHLANPQTASGTYGNYDADGSQGIEGLLVSSHGVLNRGGSTQVLANPVVSYSALGFVNTYDASGNAALLGTKSMEGRTFKSGDRFTFTVSADDGGALPSKPTVTVDGAALNGQSSAALEFGSFTFGLADAGKTYHYTVSETGSAAGVTPAAPQQVTVHVGQDTGTGVLDVSVTPNMGGLSLVNTYDATAEFRFAGTKSIEGRAISDSDRFTFDISEDGQVIATATSTGSTINFPALSYTLDDVGTHTYTVSEQAYNAAGITSDTNSYEVKVDVADNGDGTLSVSASDNAKALNFVNTYTSSGSIAINGTKNMVGRAFAQGDSFTFTLSGLDGAPLPAQTSTTITPTAGTSASFAFDAIEYTQADAGRTYTYEVRETPGSDTALSYDTSVKTVRVLVEDDGYGNVKPRIVSDSSDAVEFTNTYRASGSVLLSANKQLAGRALAAGEFSFELKDATGKLLQTKTNAADGSVNFDAIAYTLDDLAANADGTYSPAEKTYTISEVVGSDANIAYDAHSETVKVALSDAGNGTINAVADKTGLAVTFNNRVEDVTVSGTKSWSDSTGVYAPRPSSITVNLLANGVEIDEQNVTAANNWSYGFTGLPRYAADGTEIAYTVTEDAVAGYVSAVDGSNITNTPIVNGEIRFAGTKSFAGQDDGQFTFTVRENGATVATGANKADGSIEFTPITYTYRDLGTHVYTVSEDNAGQTIGGVTYDGASYVVTVDVAIDGSRLSITPSSNYNALNFVNTYAANSSFTFEGVKRIEGRAMTAADVYGFTVSEIGTANTWTASNVAANGAESGAIAYPTIEYTLADVGEHSYMVTENAPSQGGVTVQTMGYKVTVSVTDNGDGTLSVTPTRESADPKKLDFTNLYTATGSITFAGTKSMAGRALNANDVFVFDVKDTTPGSAGTTLNATNSGASINYPTIRYTQADVGRHTYTVTERSMATGGVKSSGQSYEVTVDVSDNGDGTLGIVASDNATRLDFVNTYEASGSTKLTGYKSIEGRSFANGDSATLTVSAPAGTPMPSTTQLDISPTGSTSVPVDFGTIEYSVENAGQTYTYTVSETVNGMAGTQTAASQTVTVTVIDKGNGELDVAKTSNSGENFNLVNVYNASGSVTLSATKSLTGRDWGAAENFSFALAAVDGAPMPVATGQTAIASSAARTADFGVINYTLADAGKTYTYAITENVPAGVTESSPTLNGVTYDLSTHTAKVTVSDNGDGTLSTQVVYDGSYSTAPVFSNVYTTNEATAHLGARKALTGATLAGGEFTFTLAGTSANAGSTQMVASNAADGSVTFGNLVFSEPGTYEYRISENAGDNAAYTYDSNVHSATVVVSDNGLGQLVVDSISYDGGTEQPTFTNAFFEARTPLTFTKYYFGSLAASFEFTLVETDANWRALAGNRAYSETVTNGAFNADGVASVEFSELVFHEPGDYYYTVQEKKQDGFVTDDVVYRVHVNVAADMTVTRTCQMLYDGETYDIDFADANFYNNNAVSLGFMALSAMSAGPAGAGTDIYPTVRKTVDGTTAALHEGEFSFLLSDESGNVVAIGTNDANGQVAFFQEGEGGLWFTADDVGTHKYTITELNDDISGMNFDSKTIGYTVTVTQNGDGSLSTTEVYDVNGVEVDDPTFENTTEGINVRVQKVSRMGGEGLDVCTYGLWLANSDGPDVLIQEATSDATGWIVFDNARLKQGELYYFKEVEAPTGHKVDPYRSAYVTLDPTGTYLVLAENTVDGLHAAGNEGE